MRQVFFAPELGNGCQVGMVAYGSKSQKMKVVRMRFSIQVASAVAGRSEGVPNRVVPRECPGN